MQVDEHYLEVGGLRTHYLEGGQGTTVVLVHGADFGTSAALCWEPNLGPLAERFHVVAPDLLGYGKTAKVYSFDDSRRFRARHFQDFLGACCLAPAWIVGNSAGASIGLELAADARTASLVAGVVAVAGGGPNNEQNEGRRALAEYDGSIEGMARILGELFFDPSWASGAYLERRHQASLEPGAFEYFAAGNLRRPGTRPTPRTRREIDFGAICVPTLLVGGAGDRLKPVEELEAVAAEIPGAEMLRVEDARHWPHVEHAEAFNAAVIGFIERCA